MRDAPASVAEPAPHAESAPHAPAAARLPAEVPGSGPASDTDSVADTASLAAADTGPASVTDTASLDVTETAPANSAAVMTIIRLFRAMERVDTGLTPQQYRMLKLVGEGGERSARLAERLAVAKPTLTATADGLVSAGLLCRRTEVADRRVVRLCLTLSGQAAVRRADEVYSSWLGTLLDAAGEPGRLLRDLDLLDAGLDVLRMAAQSAAAARPAGPGPVQPA